MLPPSSDPVALGPVPQSVIALKPDFCEVQFSKEILLSSDVPCKMPVISY